ncbi:MAG: tripartite tricarboxylate transporter substrate binding protein [Rubrivivax sp.]|nr:tripartite tricarboxylate transporter substrate binding protein [Rubrivivax sp.]
MRRRQGLSLVAASLLGSWAGSRSWAQAGWPARPIKLIVGFPPGGGIDFTARAIQPGLEAALGQPVVIEYKPGAGGVLAATELARAAPDGYTLLIANTGPFAIAPYLQARQPYDPLKAFSFIGQIAESGYIAATRADHPARDLKGFVEWAKAQAGKANFASGGIGSSTHLNGELLNSVAGLELLHVPYKGSAPAVQDLIGGQTHLLIDAGTVLLPQVKGGRLKALAVTGARRDVNLPDVLTVREQGFAGMEAAGFQGLVGPAGMPRDIVDRLAAELGKVLARAEVKSRFAEAGSEVMPRGAPEFAAFIKAESDKWSGVIRQRKLQLD